MTWPKMPQIHDWWWIGGTPGQTPIWNAACLTLFTQMKLSKQWLTQRCNRFTTSGGTPGQTLGWNSACLTLFTQMKSSKQS